MPTTRQSPPVSAVRAKCLRNANCVEVTHFRSSEPKETNALDALNEYNVSDPCTVPTPAQSTLTASAVYYIIGSLILKFY